MLPFLVSGDTVNTASRMESTSLPGRVQCTHRAAELLAQQDPKVPQLLRGNVSIKGKVHNTKQNTTRFAVTWIVLESCV